MKIELLMINKKRVAKKKTRDPAQWRAVKIPILKVLLQQIDCLRVQRKRQKRMLLLQPLLVINGKFDDDDTFLH
jgi:hypothetical protein